MADIFDVCVFTNVSFVLRVQKSSFQKVDFPKILKLLEIAGKNVSDHYFIRYIHLTSATKARNVL